MESGMATAMMPVAESETRKSRITATASRPPQAASCSSERDGGPDVGGLVEGDGQLDVGGDPAQVVDGLADRVHHRDGVGPGLLQHAEEDAALPVHPDDLGLVGGPVDHRGHVGDAHGRGGGGVALAGPPRRGAAGPRRRRCWRRRCSRCCRRGGCRRGRGGSSPCTAFTTSSTARPRARSASALDLDLDLADLAAADGGAGHAGDALELRLDGVVGDVVELPSRRAPRRSSATWTTGMLVTSTLMHEGLGRCRAGASSGSGPPAATRRTGRCPGSRRTGTRPGRPRCPAWRRSRSGPRPARPRRPARWGR